jgi:hypothetical protein
VNNSAKNHKHNFHFHFPEKRIKTPKISRTRWRLKQASNPNRFLHPQFQQNHRIHIQNSSIHTESSTTRPLETAISSRTKRTITNPNLPRIKFEASSWRFSVILYRIFIPEPSLLQFKLQFVTEVTNSNDHRRKRRRENKIETVPVRTNSQRRSNERRRSGIAPIYFRFQRQQITYQRNQRTAQSFPKLFSTFFLRFHHRYALNLLSFLPRSQQKCM